MNITKLKRFAAALALGLAASNASAAVLTFDSLTAMVYGDGMPLLPSMSYNGQSLSYEESGFLVTLTTPNAAPGVAHISDSTYFAQTFNWHDGFENGLASFVTLTRAGGGLFNLLGFDYYTELSTVSADGSVVGELEDEGSWTTALNGISELRLSSGAWNELDNISVEAVSAAVPLPGTVSLLLAGLAAGAVARRRKQQD